MFGSRFTGTHRTVGPLVIMMALLLLASACSSSASPDDAESSTPPDQNTTPTPGSNLLASSAGEPLSIRLSKGSSVQPPADPNRVVTGDPLDDASIAAIFDRLPEWSPDDAEQLDFNRPAATLRPPLTGETIDVSFPADVDSPAPEVPAGALEVLRVQPDGDVGIAPYVSLTFNQPMIPLATLGQLDAEDVPAQISPTVAGHWEWIGTRTLRFVGDSSDFDRLPMATSYTVSVSAGTESETGGELAADFAFDFTTPTVSISSFGPDHESLPLEPVFFASFDQRVDSDALLAAISVQADGDTVDIRLATDAEIEADDDASRRVAAAQEGRFIAFRADEPFAPDTAIAIDFGPNLPSAEGNAVDDAVKTYNVRTYQALRVEDQSCRRADQCEPGYELSLWFNNPIDADLFDASMVSVSPELPGLTVQQNGNYLTLRGATRAETTYDVTLSNTITDTFGQQLGDDEVVTFEIGTARPRLEGLGEGLITLDPLAERPSLSVRTVNHDELRVRLYPVTVDQWAAFSGVWNGPDEKPVIPSSWQAASDELIATNGEPNEIAEVTIDLADQLDDKPGHIVVLVEPTGELAQLSRDDDLYWQNRPTVVWAQSTRIGLDAFSDNDEVTFWTTDLATGEPVAGVDVSFDGATDSATTDADGLVTVGQPGDDTYKELAIGRKGDDSVILRGGWNGYEQADEGLWYVFDDRGIYRPEESVSIKGWVRRLTTSGDAQLELLGANAKINWSANDSFGNEIATGDTGVSALGGFDIGFDIPAGANLGQGGVNLNFTTVESLGGYYHPFEIQDFRRPEFEVNTRIDAPGPYLVTDPTTVAVDASYFAGGPLPNAPVEWLVSTQSATYRPPNFDDFSFGIWVPWWIDSFGHGGRGFEEDFFFDDFGPNQATEFETFSGITGADGSDFLQMDFTGDGEGQPTTVTAEATVSDVNRQAWASSTNVLVHPADVYVGLRSNRTFVEAGDPLEIEAIAATIDGEAEAGRSITIEAARLEWRLEDGTWQELPAFGETCEVVSESEPVSCSFATDIGGRYTITAVVTDAVGRENRAELTRWVSGGKPRPNRNVEQEDAILIPDAADYQPGDTAEILVESPFSPATGLLTLERNGIISTEVFAIAETSTVLNIPIANDYTPNVTVQVDLVGSSERVDDRGDPLPDGPDRPAFASGRLTLSIPPTDRTLDVTATPADSATEPGEDTTVDVAVLDADGTPIEGAELSVVVVDEAVLALTNYELADPNAVFYRELWPLLDAQYGRRSITLTNPDLLKSTGDATDSPATTAAAFDEELAQTTDDSFEGASLDFAPAEADGGGDSAARTSNQTGSGQNAPAIDVRTNFDALAVFETDVSTDASGSATIAVPLPDNLTRYRVMVVAIDGAQNFGTGESNITARLPLMVRPSAPRFLNFGDRFELPVVLQNQTDTDMQVDVALQTSNLTLTAAAGQRVTVPANDRIEVRFPAEADRAGTASFRAAAITATGTGAADAATISLPVYTPATSEAFATYGVVDDGAIAQPILTPTDVFPQFGGLEVNTSSTALQALTDAVLYLHDYRYESADGYASRILAVAALRDVLAAFDADGLPDPDDLEAQTRADIEALIGLQNTDGGFGYWRRLTPSSPFVSLHAVHALAAAQEAGFDVQSDAFNRGLDYVTNIEQYFDPLWSEDTKDALSAYALHVRLVAGDRDSAKALELYNRRGDDLQLDALAWIWPVIDGEAQDAEILRRFNNQATETAAAATFSTDYGDEAYLILHSDRRTDGIILDALIRKAPTSDLIPKVVTGLLGNQTRGRWGNSQENAFILLALNNYFDTFENETPDFVARIWLGDLYAAEHVYEGRTTDRGETLVPMAELIDRTEQAGESDIVISKDGVGRLYYRLGLRYAPDDLDLEPLDRGFVVQRAYEAVDDPDDVSQDADGVWHVRAGAKVRVNLTMVAQSRRTHVMLTDPYPAGLEPLNPDLAVTGTTPPPPETEEDGFTDGVFADEGFAGDYWPGSFWWWDWYQHDNLRDDRAEAYTSLLQGGTFDYSYVARATTPGTFVVPPAKAEEMYHPETFGRSASAVLIVESP